MQHKPTEEAALVEKHFKAMAANGSASHDEPNPLPEVETDADADSSDADFEPRSNWKNLLERNRDHNPRAIVRNANLALRYAPEWCGKLRFNAFAKAVIVPAGCSLPWMKKPLRSDLKWDDQHDRLSTDWLQNNGIYVPMHIAGQAVQTVAMERPFHPVRKYLKGLKWDGVHRVPSWLTIYLGVKHSGYVEAVGRCWLISAVARVYQPGCQADHTLILEGPQGIQKSTSLRVLAEPWFTDEIADLGSKDAALQTAGAWIIELAELEAMGKSETPKVKAFITRRCDRFRPPYGARLIDSPRQCVFAASVNPNASGTYRAFQDETGGRRFWPVRCTKIDIDGLVRDKDQLWAEACVRYRDGESHWLTDSEIIRLAECEQAERYEGDPWDALIEDWLENPLPRTVIQGQGQSRTEIPAGPFESDREAVTVADLLTHCIGRPPKDWTRADEMRVTRALTFRKWEKFRPNRLDGTRHPGKYRRKQ